MIGCPCPVSGVRLIATMTGIDGRRLDNDMSGGLSHIVEAADYMRPTEAVMFLFGDSKYRCHCNEQHFHPVEADWNIFRS